MNTEHHYDTESGRRYRYPGKKLGYPGVTSIIDSAWPSEHLERWRIGNVAKQMIENSKKLRKKLKHIESKPERVRDMYADGLQDLLMEWREDYSAADRGTRIHRGLELLYEGESKKSVKSDLKPDEYAAVLTSHSALERMGFEIEHIEVPVYGHDPVKYAGTADYIGTFPKVLRGKTKRFRAVVDLKTGRRVYKNYAPQIAAYAKAQEFIDKGGEVLPMPAVTHGFVLHASGESAEFYEVELEEGWLDFLACARIHQTHNSTKPSMMKYG